MIYNIPTNQLHCFIYLEDVNHTSALENGNFKIVPLSESPILKFLNGDELAYLSQSDLFVKRPESIPYHLGMYELRKLEDIILVIKFEDKYIICDGMHRASVMFYKGYQQIKVNLVTIQTHPQSANFEPYIKSDKFFDKL
jgi:hypothetical protein